MIHTVLAEVWPPLLLALKILKYFKGKDCALVSLAQVYTSPISQALCFVC